MIQIIAFKSVGMLGLIKSCIEALGLSQPTIHYTDDPGKLQLFENETIFLATDDTFFRTAITGEGYAKQLARNNKVVAIISKETKAQDEKVSAEEQASHVVELVKLSFAEDFFKEADIISSHMPDEDKKVFLVFS